MTTKQDRAKRPPRTEVMRTARFGMRADAEGEPNDGYTLDGYAAVFKQRSLIDSWEGRFWESISPGSMKKTFRESPPKIQFDHGRHPLIGSIPVASLTSASEEVDAELAPDGGAHVIGRVFENWLMEPVRDAIAEGAIDGMSFRFSVVREKWFDPDGKEVRDEEELQQRLFSSWWDDLPEEELLSRDLKELKVPELGPVVWPAYEQTSVSVRSKVIDLGRLTERGQRKLLAEAVFRADAAECNHQTDDDTPDITDTPSADGHVTAADDTPRSTDTSSAGEHESASPLPRGQRPIDRWVSKARDVLINIETKGK